jgi:very-short-patch-repair endonuclease
MAHDGVLSRAELRRHGWDRDAVARQVVADRWSCHGHQTVALHTSHLGEEARRWRAVWEVGLGVAALDGVTALQAAGLVGFSEDRVHVSVKHTATVQEVSGVRVHKVIRRSAGELVEGGIPRTTPAVAAVRAAHWAVSDRQAALLMVMPVQQRIITGDQLVGATRRVRGRTRRRLIPLIARDIADGAQSLGELDFAALCRSRGLPEPSRQVVQQGHQGRIYLDVRWDDADLVVEIDGAQHSWGLASMDDQFRQNAVVIRGDRVLRMTLLGLRLAPEAFMDQVCQAHARFRR